MASGSSPSSQRTVFAHYCVHPSPCASSLHVGFGASSPLYVMPAYAAHFCHEAEVVI